MLTLALRLRTITDFRNYADFVDTFWFEGTVSCQGFQVKPEDILTLLALYPLRDVRLNIENYDARELPQMQRFLREAGLLEARRRERGE
ncbi:MAG: hypothetical protein ACI3VN_06395 [Candidatus Onthomonas sp.]